MDTESTASGPADEELLRRLDSDPAAFELFYRRHVDRVIGFAARRVTDPADAADLVAATFVTVLTAARSYDRQRGEPGAWLLGITARLIASARRRQARESAALARIAGRRLIGPSDIERLLTAILDDYDQLTSPAARPHPAGRPRSARRRAATALIAGAAAAGIAAASIAATDAARPGEHAGQATGTAAGPAQTSASPKLQTAAYVVGHMKSALNANTAVVDIIDHAPDSQTGKPVIDEIWSSSLSDTYRIVDLTPAGEPVTGYLVTVTPHRTVSIVIDYGKRTWSKTTYSFGSASDGRRAGPQPVAARQQAAQLRAEVKAGRTTLVGRDTVDGQRALHLREGLANGQINLWVSPDTYLPIREIDTAPGVSQTSDQAIRDDYRWLPSTAANLRLLTPAGAIPAGFTQTSP